MRAYLIRRLLLLIPTLWILTIIVFLAVRFIPGNIVDAMVAEMEAWNAGGADIIDREAVERALGLDVPVHVQYGRWIGVLPTPDWITGESHFNGLLQGSLGDSLLGGWSIEERTIGRLPVTIELGFLAIVIGLLIALPVGIYSAMRQDTAAAYVGRTAAVIGLATPNFWLAIMVMLYPGIWWGWSPSMEYIPLVEDPLGNLGMFIIPGLILGTASAAGTMRLTRTMMLEVLRQDYIRTAWSKGLNERVVIMRHAVKNALIPIVTLGFLGYGLPPNVPDWGGLLSREGRAFMQQAPHLALWPGLCLTVTIYSLNMFGDAVRDLLDPRLRGGGGGPGVDRGRSV